MLDPDFFRRYRVLASPRWARLCAAAWTRMERSSGTRVVFEGFEPPARPVLLATNSTQKYDFLPIRVELLRRNVPTVTITKGKNYHQAAMAFLLARLGVVPLASRGYLMLVDFRALLGRRPSEEEYRLLRDHLDHGTPLPRGEPFDALLGTPRSILGHAFEPSSEPWREAMARAYRFVMGESLRLCREAVDAGHHVQIYPEGTVSSRLGQGRIGAVQFARALGVPIVPVGMSGCREAFRGQGLRLRGGEIRVRFGEPLDVSGALPASFRPFEPEDEARYRPIIQAQTDELMRRIDALLDEPYRHQPGQRSDGTQGTRRFL